MGPVPPENSIWALLGAVGAMKIAAVREVCCQGQGMPGMASSDSTMVSGTAPGFAGSAKPGTAGSQCGTDPTVWTQTVDQAASRSYR